MQVFAPEIKRAKRHRSHFGFTKWVQLRKRQGPSQAKDAMQFCSNDSKMHWNNTVLLHIAAEERRGAQQANISWEPSHVSIITPKLILIDLKNL